MDEASESNHKALRVEDVIRSHPELHFGSRAVKTLEGLDQLITDQTNGDHGFLHNVYLRNQEGEGLAKIAKSYNIDPQRLSRLLKAGGIPHLSRTEASARTWQRPEVRERRRSSASKATKRRWEDPQYRETQTKRITEVWQRVAKDPRIRKLRSTSMSSRWENSQFRVDQSRKISETVKKLWGDSNYRDRAMEAKLLAIDEGRFVFPTIYGLRRDLESSAKSMWEANIARLWKSLNIETERNVPLVLNDGRMIILVFFQIDPENDRVVVYEIMSHPLENPVGWDKLEKAISENPDWVFIPVTGSMYKEMEKQYADTIDNDPALCGWETVDDNLKTNPDKYAPIK